MLQRVAHFFTSKLKVHVRCAIGDTIYLHTYLMCFTAAAIGTLSGRSIILYSMYAACVHLYGLTSSFSKF